MSENMIRDQLLACCNEELSEDLGNLYGEQLDNKDEDTLMEALYLIEPCSIVHVMSFQAKWLGSFIFRVELSISILEKQIQFTNIPSR